MSHARPHWERNHLGEERVVFRSPRSSSRPRITDRELVNELEERNAVLAGNLETLTTSLAIQESRAWALSDEVKKLQAQIRALKLEGEEKERDIRQLLERIDKADRKRERDEEIIRMQRRGMTGRGLLEEGGLRQRLEEMTVEVENLRRRLRDSELIVENQDDTLAWMKRYMTQNGFRVEGI